MFNFKNQSNNEGVVAIITLLFVATLGLAIIVTISTSAIDELNNMI